MKITDTNSVRPTVTTRKKSRTGNASTGSTSFADLLSGMEEGAETSGTQAPAPAQATTSASALFALQEVPDEEIKREETIRHGHNLLESLDKLRTSLLMGRVPVDVLRTLDQRLKKQRALTADPALHAVMDDIELRAAVELAKLERAWNERQKADSSGSTVV